MWLIENIYQSVNLKYGVNWRKIVGVIDVILLVNSGDQQELRKIPEYFNQDWEDHGSHMKTRKIGKK